MASLPPSRDPAQHAPLDLDQLSPELERIERNPPAGAAPPRKPAPPRPTRLGAAFAVVATVAIVTLLNTLIVASANIAAPNGVILYEQVPSMKLGYYASLDGGASWQPLPTAGLPADAQVPEQVPESAVQILRDGSLVVARSSSASATRGGSPTSTAAAGPTLTPTPDYGQQSHKTVTCYLWRPGLALWTPLTQPVAADGLAPFNLYIADGAHRIVVLTLADKMSSDPAYTIVRFA